MKPPLFSSFDTRVLSARVLLFVILVRTGSDVSGITDVSVYNEEIFILTDGTKRKLHRLSQTPDVNFNIKNGIPAGSITSTFALYTRHNYFIYITHL